VASTVVDWMDCDFRCHRMGFARLCCHYCLQETRKISQATMNASLTNRLRWYSWMSLLLPIVAYVVCSEASTGHLFFHQPSHGRNVGQLRHYAFLVSMIIGSVVLLGDIGFKRWRLFWLPFVSLIFTYLLYIEAAWFTRFYD